MLCHCSFGPSASEKAEAGRISHAIDRIRDAPNSQKEQLLDALAGSSCELPELCELRRVCVDGYRRHIAGLSATLRAKQLLSNGGSDAEATRALDQASRELAAAAPEIGRCADAQGAARRKYKF